MKHQLLLTITLTILFTLISGVPTSSSIEVVNALTKRSNLYCHDGLSAQECEDDYGCYCDDSGEIFTPDYPEDGESCTSRYCWCTY